MPVKTKDVSANEMVMLLLIFLNAVIVKVAFVRTSNWYFALIVTVPLLLVSVYYSREKKQKNMAVEMTESKGFLVSIFKYLN